MRLLILLAILIPTISVAAPKDDYLDTAKIFAAQAFGVRSENIVISVKDTTKASWLSWKRRGAFWISPAIITWDEGVQPVWSLGVGTSYALGKHSGVLGRVYREYNSGIVRPEFGWAIFF